MDTLHSFLKPYLDHPLKGLGVLPVTLSTFTFCTACVALPYAFAWALVGQSIRKAQESGVGGNDDEERVSQFIAVIGAVVLLLTLFVLGYYSKKAVNHSMEREALQRQRAARGKAGTGEVELDDYSEEDQLLIRVSEEEVAQVAVAVEEGGT